MTDVDDSKKSYNRRYHIPSDKVFNALLSVVLTRVPKIFRYHLKLKEELPKDPDKPIGKESVSSP